MPNATQKIKITSDLLPHLEILNIHANNRVVVWSEIKTAYKKRALIFHPDKGGSAKAFIELNDAFEYLERRANNRGLLGLHRRSMDKTSSVSESSEEIFNETDADFVEFRRTMKADFDEIRASLNKCQTTLVDTLRTSSDKLTAGFDRIDVELQNLTFLLCSSCFFVGILLVVGVYELKNEGDISHNDFCALSLVGTGLAVAGGVLIANSLFSSSKSLNSANKPDSKEHAQAATMKINQY